jgi:hypothetical protein
LQKKRSAKNPNGATEDIDGAAEGSVIDPDIKGQRQQPNKKKKKKK